MDLVARFLEYATAFEQTYRDDRWERLREYFSEDAVYSVAGGPPFAGRWEGREAVIRRLRESVDEFDRRFEERVIEDIGGPRLEQDCVSIDFTVRYCSPGRPDLRIEGSERAVFRDGQISRLEDSMQAGTEETARALVDVRPGS